jgi:integrase
MNVNAGYVSPFEIMGEKLHAKLNRTKHGNRTKKALTKDELKTLLGFLLKDTSVAGLENYALVFMFATSGLRASELCSLRWGDLEQSEGKWTARFTGKGDREAEQELFSSAVQATSAYFRAHFGRSPKPQDSVYWTLPRFHHQQVEPLQYHTLWARVKKIGVTAKKAGVFECDLDFSPHLFRRTYATLLYKSGMKLKAVQRLTRHSNVETLCRFYVDDSEPASPYLSEALE